MQRRTATSVSSSVIQATSLSPVWTTTLPVDNRLISSGHTDSSTPLQSFPGALVGTELPLKTPHIIGPSWGDFISKLQIISSTKTKNILRYLHYVPVTKMGLTPKYAQATMQLLICQLEDSFICVVWVFPTFRGIFRGHTASRIFYLHLDFELPWREWDCKQSSCRAEQAGPQHRDLWQSLFSVLHGYAVCRWCKRQHESIECCFQDTSHELGGKSFWVPCQTWRHPFYKIDMKL